MEREKTVERNTRETQIRLTLNLDGTGRYEVHTGIGMLDHMLESFARHGLFDLVVEATGDLHVDEHHLVEDVAICLGRAFDQALGDRAGIVRSASLHMPMDEALALVAVDIGGRGYAVLDIAFDRERIGTLPAELVGHFLWSFAQEARLNLHVRLLAGQNDHHRSEAIFKGLARTLDAATQIDPRRLGQVPSTKGVIEQRAMSDEQ